MSAETPTDHPPDVSPAEVEVSEDESTPESAALSHIAGLLQAGDNGANWFFWIAGLSLVNTAIAHSGGSMQFVIGLGVTVIVDAIAQALIQEQPDLRVIASSIAIGFSVFCSIISCLFGWLSRKRIIPIFALGMFIYFLDGLIFVLCQDWFSAAFHGYALFSMWSGLSAYRQFNQFENELADAAEPA
ncbi:hypothetical protein GC163_18685 [bacterium]|nr:hypothetical protein [bacterium]